MLPPDSFLAAFFPFLLLDFIHFHRILYRHIQCLGKPVGRFQTKHMPGTGFWQ